MLSNMLEQFCVEALLDFYNNNNISFADYLDDNIVWYGPMEGQKIQGKENFINAFSSSKGKIKFNIENLSTKLIPLKAEVFLLIATYELYACYPDGRIVRFDQHMVIVSRRRRINGTEQWKSPLIHVSNVFHEESGRDRHLLTGEELNKDVLELFVNNRGNVKKILFSGKNNSNYYVAEDSIRYIEGGKGVRSYIHTKDGVYTVNHILKDVAEKLPDYYYRCHSSYIVNLRCITKISNYKIFLDGGEEIPVPVKRYSQVRNDINSLIEKL
ncbi:MAG: LytTR family transcriptional regulator [Ruminococcaceae bacterium]|nr:LytTR family transcriptional regulator [Oscillospiraceae bacterium]